MARKIIDYLPPKPEKASVRLEIDKTLYEEGKKRLKKMGYTITDFLEASFKRLLDETQVSSKDSERR